MTGSWDEGERDSPCARSLAQRAGFPGFRIITNIHPKARASLPVAEEVLPPHTSFLALEKPGAGALGLGNEGHLEFEPERPWNQVPCPH